MDDREILYCDPETGIQVKAFTFQDETRFAITRPALPAEFPWDLHSNGMSLSREEFKALAEWFNKDK